MAELEQAFDFSDDFFDPPTPAPNSNEEIITQDTTQTPPAADTNPPPIALIGSDLVETYIMGLQAAAADFPTRIVGTIRHPTTQNNPNMTPNTGQSDSLPSNETDGILPAPDANSEQTPVNPTPPAGTNNSPPHTPVMTQRPSITEMIVLSIFPGGRPNMRTSQAQPTSNGRAHSGNSNSLFCANEKNVPSLQTLAARGIKHVRVDDIPPHLAGTVFSENMGFRLEQAPLEFIEQMVDAGAKVRPGVLTGALLAVSAAETPGGRCTQYRRQMELIGLAEDRQILLETLLITCHIVETTGTPEPARPTTQPAARTEIPLDPPSAPDHVTTSSPTPPYQPNSDHPSNTVHPSVHISEAKSTKKSTMDTNVLMAVTLTSLGLSDRQITAAFSNTLCYYSRAHDILLHDKRVWWCNCDHLHDDSRMEHLGVFDPMSLRLMRNSQTLETPLPVLMAIVDSSLPLHVVRRLERMFPREFQKHVNCISFAGTTPLLRSLALSRLALAGLLEKSGGDLQVNDVKGRGAQVYVREGVLAQFAWQLGVSVTPLPEAGGSVPVMNGV